MLKCNHGHNRDDDDSQLQMQILKLKSSLDKHRKLMKLWCCIANIDYEPFDDQWWNLFELEL